MNRIDYARIARAIAFYEDLGYQYVEVPWSVPRWATAVTCPYPDLMVPFQDADDILVGSSEQGFIYLDGLDMIPSDGKFVACTPCFRAGDSADEFHHASFMKVELFRTDIVDKYSVDEIVMAVTEFVRIELPRAEYLLERVPSTTLDGPELSTTEMTDLNLNGLEIGSYGIRETERETVPFRQAWVFGTGLAEPRFSQASALPSPLKDLPF